MIALTRLGMRDDYEWTRREAHCWLTEPRSPTKTAVSARAEVEQIGIARGFDN